MRFVVFLLLIVGAVLIACLGFNGQLRFLMPESRLGIFETRIASVEDEFMRRSSALQENFIHFDQCIRRDDCDPTRILAERDRLLQELWPDMLNRLLVSDDWGQGGQTATLHQHFSEDVQRAGGVERARLCQPIFKYHLLSNSSETVHSYHGLRCPSR